MYLSIFQEVLPLHNTPQEDLQAQLVSSLSDPRLARLVDRYACRNTYIKKRFHEVPSFTSPLIQSDSDLSGKMGFYREIVLRQIFDLYRDILVSPDMLIHVTCTGYVSPSPIQELVVKKNWTQTCSVLHAYHMGCYAAFPAMRMAMGELAYAAQNSRAIDRVDVVHSELCSLHFQPSRLSDPEQIVVQTLFADGYVKYSLTQEAPAAPAFRILGLHELQIEGTPQHMTWTPGARGFQMSLSREVPQSIRGSLGLFLGQLMSKCGYAQPVRDLIYAIHPGGPLIISEVQKALELSDDQVFMSRKVLLERGNMSSVTVPLILKEILSSGMYASGQIVLSVAFGPGLTIYGGLFCKV